MALICPKCGSQDVSQEIDSYHCLQCNAYHQIGTDVPRHPDPNLPYDDADPTTGHHDPSLVHHGTHPYDHGVPMETPPEEVATEEAPAEEEPSGGSDSGTEEEAPAE